MFVVGLSMMQEFWEHDQRNAVYKKNIYETV